VSCCEGGAAWRRRGGAERAARAPRAAQVGQHGALDGEPRAGHGQVRAPARAHVLPPRGAIVGEMPKTAVVAVRAFQLVQAGVIYCGGNAGDRVAGTWRGGKGDTAV